MGATSTVPRSPNLFKRVFLPVLGLFLVTAFGVRLAFDRDFYTGLRDTVRMLDPQFLKQWWRVGHVMELAHYDYLHPEKVTYDKLADSALNHVLDGLDHFSDYLPPKDFRDFNNESAQRPVGVGVEIERRNGRVQIVRVFLNSPAAKNQWLPNDRIVEINGVDVRDFTVTGVSDLLRGPEGSLVKVTRETPGEVVHQDTLTRGGFDVPSVRDSEKRADGVGYLRITQFGENTGADFRDGLDGLMKPSALRGLILDLRDNPGGLLVDQDGKSPVLELMETLLPTNTRVVITQGRNPSSAKSLVTTGKGDLHLDEGAPIVVLVNENTASAAEIVAGSLQDYHRAVILGQTTYGKGVVQSIIDLNDGSGVRLTTEAYKLPGPNGTKPRDIQGFGITPDVPMTLTQDERDLMRFERSDLRADLNRFTPEQFTATFGFAPVPDAQIETAASLIVAATPNYKK